MLRQQFLKRAINLWDACLKWMTWNIVPLIGTLTLVCWCKGPCLIKGLEENNRYHTKTETSNIKIKKIFVSFFFYDSQTLKISCVSFFYDFQALKISCGRLPFSIS